jgi:ketosteroid isomerase-like protein
MPAAARLAALAATASALAAAGCGGGAPGVTRTVTAPSADSATRVIRAWSDTLRGGDVDRAARYFALPSIVQVQPGGPAERITRRSEAVAFQAILPCGAVLLSAAREGRYVTALFRLTSRSGATCDAPGATARTAFVVRRGKIAEWRRVPDEPGDDGRGRSEAPPV